MYIFRINQGGADVVFDVIGGKLFQTCFRSTRWNSSKTQTYSGIIVAGFASGNVPTIPLNHLLVKNTNVYGIYIGGFKKNNPEVIEEVSNQLSQNRVSINYAIYI